MTSVPYRVPQESAAVPLPVGGELLPATALGPSWLPAQWSVPGGIPSHVLPCSVVTGVCRPAPPTGEPTGEGWKWGVLGPGGWGPWQCGWAGWAEAPAGARPPPPVGPYSRGQAGALPRTRRGTQLHKGSHPHQPHPKPASSLLSPGWRQEAARGVPGAPGPCSPAASMADTAVTGPPRVHSAVLLPRPSPQLRVLTVLKEVTRSCW